MAMLVFQDPSPIIYDGVDEIQILITLSSVFVLQHTGKMWIFSPF